MDSKAIKGKGADHHSAVGTGGYPALCWREILKNVTFEEILNDLWDYFYGPPTRWEEKLTLQLM